MALFALLENPRWLGLPATTWIIFAWFALACTQTVQKDTHREVMHGEKYSDNPIHHELWDRFNALVSLLFFVQYALLISLYFFDGNFNRVVSVWLITFLVAVVARPVMLIVGSILLSPFRSLWKRAVIKA